MASRASSALCWARSSSSPPRRWGRALRAAAHLEAGGLEQQLAQVAEGLVALGAVGAQALQPGTRLVVDAGLRDCCLWARDGQLPP